MALSTGNKVLWSDIQAIYNNLNTAKDYLSQSRVTVPGNPGQTVPSTVSDLKSAIESCSSNGYIGSTANTGITVPTSGTLLYPGIFNTMNDTINKIKNTCLHNSSFYTTDNSFGSFSCNGFGSFDINMFHSKASSSNSGFGPHNGF